MSTEPWPEGYGRVVLASLDSTNDEAARRFSTLAGPTWILALEQRAARGRRGRDWRHPAGNFAATLALPAPGGIGRSAQKSFVAALALFDAFVAASGRAEPFALKWPNDVLLNGGKVAGILLESISPGADIAGLAVGIGVNLRAAPDPGALAPGALNPVSLLQETGARVTAPEFLDLLAPAFARYARQHDQLGFAPIRAAWLARAGRLGEVITARTGREDVTGVFETIDQNGYLVMTTPRGRRAIAAGDVFF